MSALPEFKQGMVAMKTIIIAALISATVWTAPSHALDVPTGDVILTVKGAVGETNHGSQAVFDREMLEALDGRVAKMETPWTTGQVEFSGPYLRAVLNAAGAKGSYLIIRALNDYSARIPMADAEKLDTILASRMFGKEMVVRDKGPLMLVYPFDQDKALYNEKYFARSVWQIKEIEVAE